MTKISIFFATVVWLYGASIFAADKLLRNLSPLRRRLGPMFLWGVIFSPIPSNPCSLGWVMVAAFCCRGMMGKPGRRSFFGHLGSDHSPWATKAVAYTDGVFVVPIGWGAPSHWLASEDGVNWRHLTSGDSTLKGVKGAEEDPTVMPGTWGMAGGKGVFVSGGYMVMGATADFGKTISTFSLREFKSDPRPRKLVTHHVGPVYCGDDSGRFLALGNDRSTEIRCLVISIRRTISGKAGPGSSLSAQREMRGLQRHRIQRKTGRESATRRDRMCLCRVMRVTLGKGHSPPVWNGLR